MESAIKVKVKSKQRKIGYRMSYDIDLVIPMVFPQDPEWQRDYARYHGNVDATKYVRYRSWGTEELQIRCVMKYMPWVRRIYILLAKESQVQKWMMEIQTPPLTLPLDGRRVAVAGEQETHGAQRTRDGMGMGGVEVCLMFHRDFIPERYLPCFASPCIEMFLHRIPGLSECFIYANDDMFPLSPMEPEDFFRAHPCPSPDMGGEILPCQHITDKAYPANPNTFHKKCMWQQNMIGKPFGKHFTETYPETGHIFSAILKSSCEEVWKRHGEEITRYLSPIGRTDRSANNWIYLLYQQYSGKYVDYRPTRHYTDHNTPTRKLVEIIRDPKAGIVCLNDNEKIVDWEQRAETVRREIEKKLDDTCIAICSIGRMENRYAREFVEHYLGMGFNHIYICDNNHDGEERFEDVLSDKIAEGAVSVHDYRNREAVQATAYNEMYRQYGGQYDWMAFFDFDEFLVMQHGTVKQWLETIPESDDVAVVNWMCMTDGGMIRDDGRPCTERFTEAMPYDRCVQRDFPENNHVKSFVRGRIGDVFFKNPHVPATPHNPNPSPFRPYDFSQCYLKHFTTKTIGEWLAVKCRKGVGDRSKESFDRKYRDRFFKYNKMTPEKQAYMDDFARELTVAVVHYNTPKLTRAAILSLWKHTPGCRVVVFDNSDKLTIAGCRQWDTLRYNPLVTIIDNTKGQVIDFDRLLEQYPDREFFDRNMSNFGSTKHTASVDKLFDLLPNGFLLMDSDVLFKRDVSGLVDRSVAATGTLKPNSNVMRLLPLLCWINVPMLREKGIRYFNGEKMWALSKRYPNNRYDTGAWVLEEIRRNGLPIREVSAKDYVLHLGHASWKGNRSPMNWVREHRSLWE